MYLTGAGGTGKSEVVKALREFSQRWGIADMLCVTATTGIAACVIGGMTWHKATGHFSFVKNSAKIGVRELWSSIAVLVIDEVSMMSAKQLFQLNKWLKDLKNEPNIAFGGVHVIFSGLSCALDIKDNLAKEDLSSVVASYMDVLAGERRAVMVCVAE